MTPPAPSSAPDPTANTYLFTPLSAIAPSVSWFQRRSVLQKISLGYGAAIGVALLGIVTGIVYGTQVQREAWRREDIAEGEAELLNDLRVLVLEVRTHELQLSSLVDNPAEMLVEQEEIWGHEAALLDVWAAAQTFAAEHPHAAPSTPVAELGAETAEHDSDADQAEAHVETLSDLLAKYDRPLQDYLTNLKILLANIDITALEQDPIAQSVVRQRLLSFNSSPIARTIQEVSHDLEELVETANLEATRAEEQWQTATQLSHKIMIFSALISAILASILAVLTSRAIARPLERANHVAQSVVREANFDLQVPITTMDEIGTLTESLNLMIRRVKELLTEQEETARQKLLQNEKMSSLGQMLAGVAHEINNPVNFVYGNIDCAENYVHDLLDLIHAYEDTVETPAAIVLEKAEEIDLEFLQEDLPKLLQSMKVGADRARQIVLSLRNFSRLDEGNPHPVNLSEILDSTLLILNNRLKNGITVDRRYDPDVSAPEGYAGALYQVFTNIIGNAIDALEEAQRSDKTIIIHVRNALSQQVAIHIRDNGAGIAPEHQSKIFETFYTTKAIGVGTGLGLAISRQIVEEKHGGQLTFVSTPGEGTEFIVTLPLHQKIPALAAVATVS